MSRQAYTIYTDGGSRGNPGPAAAGYVIFDPAGGRAAAKGVYLGQATNNAAEYTGIIESLKHAARLGAKAVCLYSDSELLVRQISGQYKVKSPNLKQFYAQTMELLAGFQGYHIEHVRRENNTQADSLVNKALDCRADVEPTPAPAAKPVKKGPKLRLGVMLSGGGTTMVNILEQIQQGNLHAEIPIVISSRKAVAGVERAKKAHLPVQIIRRKDWPDLQQFSDKIEQTLVKAGVDLVIQAGWLCFWQIPKRFENRVMNIHPSLLPAFGGKGMYGGHVHQAVLERGCKVSGCTVHFATNQYDQGPIIIQRCCDVAQDDTAQSLADRVFEQECLAYPEAIRLFSQGRLKVMGQIVKIEPQSQAD